MSERIDHLFAIEAIKQLKARYFRLLDTKAWTQWAELFTEDAVMDVSDDSPHGIVRGREAIVSGVSGVLREARTAHYGHMPEIELTGAETARGIWAMEDHVEFPASGGDPRGLRGTGWYHETYRLEDGAWRIATMKLVRLRVERFGD